MSLRDLKNLAPWQWESKVAQKKHTVGPKGLQDFAEVARALQGDGESTSYADFKEKQISSSKRRRAPKEADEAAAGAFKEPAQQRVAPVADAILAASTPALKIKKQRPAAQTPAAEPSSGSVDISGQQHSSPPAASTPAAARSVPSALDNTSQKQQPQQVAPLFVCKTTQHATPSAARTPSYATASRLQHATPSAARTPAAGASAANLLSDAFSPCPLPTPAPYAPLRFDSSSTPAAAHGSSSSLPGSAVKASATSNSLKPQGSGSGLGFAGFSSIGMQRNGRAAAAAAGTPLPRPQFTPRSMPPPANKRSSLAATATTPISTAAASGGSSSSMKRSPFAAETPVAAMLPRLQPLLSGAAAASPGDVSPQGSPDGGLAALAGNSSAGQSLQEALLGNTSLFSPRGQVQGSLEAVFRSSNSPAAPAAMTPGIAATPDAAVAKSNAGVAATTCASARLPAKLRCKKDASSRSAAGAAPATSPADVSVDRPGSDSSREASPAAADTHSVAALAAAAAAAAAAQHEQLQHTTAGTSSSGRRRSNSFGPSEQHGTPGVLAGNGSSRAAFVTPAGRMGLKRLWCHTHAAAMAAEAAAAAGDASPEGVAFKVACRSRSPDSQAVALSAELLLAAAEMDSPQPAEAAATQEAAAAPFGHTAPADDAMEVDPHDSQQAQQTIEPAAEAVDVGRDEPATTAAAEEDRQRHMQQQQVRRTSDQGNNKPAAAAVSEQRTLCDAGTSLLLPPAAQLRLRQQEQRQQQHHAAEAGNVSCKLAGTAGTPSANLAGQQGSAAAPFCSRQCAAQGGVMSHTNKARGVTGAGQPGTAAAAAAAAAGLQQQVGQLNQQLAAIGYTAGSYNSYSNSHISSSNATAPNSAAAVSGSASYPAVSAAPNPQPRGPASGDGGGDATGRQPHVTPALHAVQCGVRTSHSGVLLHAGLPGVQLSQQQQQALAAAAWSNTRLLMQQQGVALGAAASTAAAAGSAVSQHRLARRSHTPEPAAMAAAFNAAAAKVRPAVGTAAVREQHPTQQQQQVGQVAAGVQLLPSIQPLSVPGMLSDDEAWKIALTQPWVIQQETARAQQLLAQVGKGAAAAAVGSMADSKAAPPAAARLAAGPAKYGTENATAAAGGCGVMQVPACRKAVAAVDVSPITARNSCQGVRSIAHVQQQLYMKGVQQQQQQQRQGPGPRVGGVLGGTLRSSNIVNTL